MKSDQIYRRKARQRAKREVQRWVSLCRQTTRLGCSREVVSHLHHPFSQSISLWFRCCSREIRRRIWFDTEGLRLS
jgi:hypothetical protein